MGIIASIALLIEITFTVLFFIAKRDPSGTNNKDARCIVRHGDNKPVTWTTDSSYEKIKSDLGTSAVDETGYLIFLLEFGAYVHLLHAIFFFNTMVGLMFRKREPGVVFMMCNMCLWVPQIVQVIMSLTHINDFFAKICSEAPESRP